MSDTYRKDTSGRVVSLSTPSNGGRSGPRGRAIEVPPLYRRPAPDRDFQGCMKARA